MDSAVLVAIITAGISLIGTVITVVAANKSTLAAMSEQSKLADEKIHGEINVIRQQIETLSERVEKHNKVVERTFALERRMDVAEERIKVGNHRIDDLEGGKAHD